LVLLHRHVAATKLTCNSANGVGRTRAFVCSLVLSVLSDGRQGVGKDRRVSGGRVYWRMIPRGSGSDRIGWATEMEGDQVERKEEVAWGERRRE
jgi:hypothetical protein